MASVPATLEPADRGHLPQLDGVRGIAVLLVILYHAAKGLRPETLPDHFAKAATSIGWSGVDLFFLLSGFLITRILIASKESARYYRDFYLKRLLRIFPLYYAFLLVALALKAMTDVPLYDLGNRQFASLFLYLSNFEIAFNGWMKRSFSHFWSLAVEEQFYLLWPVVVLKLRAETLRATCVLLAFASPLLRLVFHAAGHPVDMSYVLLPTRMEPLALGALMATVPLSSLATTKGKRAGRGALFTGLALLAAVALWSGRLGWHQPGLFRHTVLFSGLALFYGGLLHHALTCNDRAEAWRFFRSDFLRRCGKYSYALYVLHYPIDSLLRWAHWHPRRLAMPWDSMTLSLLLYALVLFALTYAASALSWRFLEGPCLRLKERLVPPRGLPPAESAR